MRKSLILIGAFASTLSFSEVAFADVIRIETNSWAKRSKVTWTGVLDKIDARTGLVSFSYVDASGARKTLSVHYSRIYSLQIDDRPPIRKNFPPIVARLSEPLRSRIINSAVELRRSSNLLARVPDDVDFTPGENRIKVFGALHSADSRFITLRAETTNSTKEIRIRRRELLTWIRSPK